MWLLKGLGHLGRTEKREEAQKQAMKPRKKFQRGEGWRKKQSLTERKRREAEDRKRKRSRGGGSKGKKERRRKGGRLRYLSTSSPRLHS